MPNRSSQRQITPTDHMAGAAVLGLLLAVYLFTASLTFISGDELFLYDTTESFARRGSVMRNETSDMDWPGHTYVEPMQSLLSAPIFWIADQVDTVGNAHATLLSNAVITAATALLLFLYVRRLRYTRGVAVTVGLLYGLTTIAWPYSKNYFREPLGGLALFAAAYCFLRWRQILDEQQSFPYTWLAMGITCGVVSILTKESGVVGMPMLFLVLLVGRRSIPHRRKEWMRLALMVSVLFAIAFAGLHFYKEVMGAAVFRFQPLSQISHIYANLWDFGLVWDGIIGLLISPGKGVFWHSPILLLALVAPWIAGKRKLETSWPILMLVTFVVVYALVREYMWFGGTNWGPRYLVPTTPFLMIAVSPAVDRARSEGSSRLWRILVASLALAGLLVQIGAVSINPLDYYRVLAETGIVGASWTVALWSIRHSAILGHWQLLLEGNPLDFAWARVSTGNPDWLLAVMLLGVVAVFAWVLIRIVYSEGGRAVLAGVLIIGSLVLATVTLVGLRRVYPDERFRGDNNSLHAMRRALQESDLPDPVVFLNNRTYFDFMLNYYKGRAVWYTLELNQNELLHAGELAPAPSTEPIELLNEEAWSRVDYFTREHQTAVLVMETGPYHTNVVRAMEWWMNSEFHRIRTLEFSDNVRLIEFSSVAAPSRYSDPEFRLDLTLGDGISLLGYDPQPPPGLLMPASVLNVSTQWKSLQDIGHDYIIGTYLMTPQGRIAVQDDSMPVGGFWPTSTWREGDIVRHNVALVLPSDLAPGHYEVWTLMYSPVDGSRIPISDATGITIRDHEVLYSVEIAR